jgi:hypothetical protein
MLAKTIEQPVGAGGGAEDYIYIEDQKAQGTNGGTATLGSWQTRDLNTEVHDSGGHASIASNQITLAAGTYRFSISAPAFSVNQHQARLQNVSDATTVKEGTSTYASSGTPAAPTRSFIKGRFTIASSKTFEIQHKVTSTKATDGFGTQVNFTTEVFTTAEFWKEN